jgi:hypothetical protein
LPGLRYHPEGDAIVVHNGGQSYNRPLYCSRIWPVVYAGDKPQLLGLDWAGGFGRLNIGLIRQGKGIWLHDFQDITARYRPGLMEWLLRDEQLAGLTLTLEAVTLEKGAGFAVKLRAEGATGQDTVVWAYGDARAASGPLGSQSSWESLADAQLLYRYSVSADGFDIRLEKPTHILKDLPPLRVTGRFPAGTALRIASGAVEHDPATFAASAENPKRPAVCATLPLRTQVQLCMAVFVDTITDRPYSGYGTSTVEMQNSESTSVPERELDPKVRGFDQSLPADMAAVFAAGMRRAERLGKQVVVETPDPYFNAQVAASCAAMEGLFVAPSFVHGGSMWRQQQPGWRMMDGATMYGWHELVKMEAKYYLGFQLHESPKTAPHPIELGTVQAPESRFYGKGWIPRDQSVYNFQVQFFEELVRSWRWTADPELEEILLPALELHLERARECFDPDDDGLYESYLDSWPTDSVWYNGGGSVEESSYCYYMLRAAAEMRLRRGDQDAAARHTARAEKIRKALNDVLWLKDKGHYASYLEQGGRQRVHEDAWLYSQFLPIDLGIASAEQALQALHYTEWGLERIKLPYGGELCHTSNWVPSKWSVRELYGGDIYHLALTYFQTGLGDAGWELLRGAFLESGYGDERPKAAYGNIKNFLSPGGLSHPACSIDFNDVTTMFCRASVEGLFGCRPDYPSGIVHVEPALPAAWDKAALRTPDISVVFRRNGAKGVYEVELTRPARLMARLPVHAGGVKRATVNGTEAKHRWEPWFGCGMVHVEVAKGSRFTIEMELDGRCSPAAEIRTVKKAGESLELTSADGPIVEIKDPQGCLEGLQIVNGKAEARVTSHAGHYAVLARTGSPQSAHWAVQKIQVTDPDGEAHKAAKTLLVPPANAEWKAVDLRGTYNGDIRTIFQQKYLSPRTATCSLRLGTDGYSPWTFPYWGMKPPVIGLEELAEGKLVHGDWLVAPQSARFAKLPEERNIAFASLWDNWPRLISVPVNAAAESVWLLVCGSTNPMQGRIANAALRFRYSDGQEEKLELVPPFNFWTLCPFGGVDYDYARDAFCLPKTPPPQVQLGKNCRAMVYSWKLRAGVALKEVALEALSQDVVIGLMGVSLVNPA